MAELKYDENGVPVRNFPVTLKRGDDTLIAHTEADVVNAEWNGFSSPEDAKAHAAGTKAAQKQSE